MHLELSPLCSIISKILLYNKYENLCRVKKQANNLHLCHCNTFHSKTTSCSIVLTECLSPKDPSAGKLRQYTGRTCRTLGKLVFRVVGSSQGRTCMLLIGYGRHGCKEQFSSWKGKPCKGSLAITYSLSSLNQNCQATTLCRVGARMSQKGSVLP
jgi:hypothetical protein